jgi:hypothetical protein
MKRFIQYLQEAPLPEDWDAAIYSERVPFAQRIRYAKAKAKQLGAGSSRVAFEIPYQGRRTVLKIAKNNKGMAQNAEEASALSDWYLKGLNLTIPLIDYDEQTDSPTWIHTEFATKAKNSDFKKATGAPLYDFVMYCVRQSGRERSGSNKPEDYGIDPDSELVQNFTDYVGNYTHHPWVEYTNLRNWGIYQGNPVIIDIGLTQDIWNDHYKR